MTVRAKVILSTGWFLLYYVLYHFKKLARVNSFEVVLSEWAITGN